MKAGTQTAQEIYIAVGVALSFCEGSQDVIMGVFKTLCAKTEPVAFDTYVGSNRLKRTQMLKQAFIAYPDHYTSDEANTILQAVAELNKLAPIRNQIAHGHCAKQKSVKDGKVVLDGHYLVPSLNEDGDQIDREQRYALTAVEINEWRDAVREERGKILDVLFAPQIRAQEAYH